MSKKKKSIHAEDVILNAEETAAFSRISLNTTYLLLAEGKIPGVKVGRQWRVSRKALEAYLNGGTQ